MNRSRTSTPTKSAKKEPKPIKDVEEEFAKRALQLMTSFYEPMPVSDILAFPPVEDMKSPMRQEKRVAFNSSIADLRVKRVIENQGQAVRDFNADFAQKVDALAEECKNSIVNLDDVFGAEAVERPTKPLYILNEEKDVAEAEKRKRIHMKSLDIAKIESEMKKRLSGAEEQGKKRAENRVKRLGKYNEKNKVDRTYQEPWRGRLQEFHSLTKYHPDNGYPVKQKKPSTPKSKQESSYYNDD